MRTDVKTFKNGTNAYIEISYWADSRHYESGHVHPIEGEQYKTVVVPPESLFTFEDAEQNGSDILAVCLASNLTLVEI